MTIDMADIGPTSDNWLGRNGYPDPGFDGLVDELLLERTAMTDSEVAAMYAAGPGRPSVRIDRASACTQPGVVVDNSATAVDWMVTVRAAASFGGTAGPNSALFRHGDTGRVSTAALPPGVPVAWVDVDYALFRYDTGELVGQGSERVTCS